MRFLFNKSIPFWLIFAWLLWLPISIYAAATIPEKPNPPRLANDYAELLSTEQLGALENQLRQLNDTSSNQIVVVIVPTVGDHEISMYATELGHSWGVGQKEADNGAVMVVAVNDRKVWIATGYGLEDVIPDAISKRIIEQVILPKFKQGDFFGGISSAVQVMGDLAVGKINEKSITSDEEKESPIWLIIVVIVFLIMFFFGGGTGGDHYSSKGHRNWHGRGWYYGGFGSGFGGGGGGGGSFGGFGGGGFGGGGAGGSW